MDKTQAMASYFLLCCKGITSEPIAVYLVDGPTDRPGRYVNGQVGKADKGYRIIINRSESDWSFYKALWHELSHIVSGDVGSELYGKTPASASDHVAAVRGWGDGVERGMKAAFDPVKAERVSEAEIKADMYGLFHAKRTLPGLNRYLASMADHITETTPGQRWEKALMRQTDIALKRADVALLRYNNNHFPGAWSKSVMGHIVETGQRLAECDRRLDAMEDRLLHGLVVEQ